MKIETRKATLDDLPILLEFEQQLIYVERPMDPSLEQIKETHYYDISAFITTDNSTLYVAVIEEEIVGCGYGLIRPNKSKFTQKEHGFIGFIYVKDAFRGNGIGKLIINTICDWFKTKDISEVRLTVYTKNHTAIKAYEKIGFEKNIVEMLYYI